MDFGRILDEWEMNGGKKSGSSKKKGMDDYLEMYSPNDEVRRSRREADETSDERIGEQRNKLLRMEPERTLDLHRMTADEAVKRVDSFLRECVRDGLKKVLIVHGKGWHSLSDPVLGKRVVQFIRNCPNAGEYGTAPKALGGSGALWVVLRYRSR
jgi:DNA-nicking Smr family endonuclease